MARDSGPGVGGNIGAYRIEDVLGRGGMGVVYRAVDTRLDRKVALKVLPPEYSDDPTFRARFLRESRVAASIDHPGVIPIYEAGDADGQLYIAMRHVDGTDLAQLLRTGGALDPDRALALTAQLAAALDAAHARELVHRDVKPSNALVARSEAGDEHVYLSDFGLSRKATGDATLSATGTFVGTVKYMAPEVIRGEPATPRSDLYSLGCVLFECLTGEAPFTGPSDAAVVYGHLEQPPPRPSERRPGLPKALDEVLERALDKEPERRWASGGALVQAARSALGGRSPRRAPGAHQRRRVLAAAGAALVLAAGGLVAARSGEGPQLALVRADSLAIIDPERGTLTHQVELEGAPAAVAEGAGAVWVTDEDRDVVTRIDRSTQTIRQTIPVGHGPVAIASDGDVAVWVANRDDGTVSVISPQTNEVVDTIRVGRSVEDLCIDGGRVWVATPLDHAVVRYDARTGRRLGAVRLDDQPERLACADGAIWTSSPSSGTVTEISAAAAGPVRTVQLARGVAAIAVGAGGVWVANPLDGTVSRIDPGRGAVTATIPLGATDGPAHVAVTEDAVWVSSETGGAVVRVDPVRAEVVEELALGSRPQGLSVVEGELWVGVADTGAEHRGGTLRLEFALPVETLKDMPFQVLALSGDGLTGFRRQGGSMGAMLVPNLAQALPVPTDAGRTYAFRLRDGLRYSDGTPVRASHVRLGAERSARLYNYGLFDRVRGARRCSPRRCDLSRGIVADDATGTVVFRLTEPDPDLLYELASPFAAVVPPGVSVDEIPPATGPYMITDFEPGRSVRLERNPHFESWSALARPDGFVDAVDVRAGVSREGAVDRVLSGRVDRINNFDVDVPSQQLRTARRRAPGQVRASIAPVTTYFTFSTRRPPFDRVEARRAVAHAFDRRAAVKAIGGREVAQETCQVLPPSFPGHRPYCPYTEPGSQGAAGTPRVGEARRLVRRSGTVGARVTVQVPNMLPPALGRVMARTLRRLGYDVELRALTPDEHFARMHDPSREPPDMAFYPWFADYPAPGTFFELFACDAVAAGQNPARFCDREVDRLAAEAARLQMVDPGAADEQWARAERRLVNLAPAVAMYNLLNVDVLSERVGGYRTLPQYGMLLDQAWVR